MGLRMHGYSHPFQTAACGRASGWQLPHLLAVFVLCCQSVSATAGVPPGFAVTPYVGGLSAPVDLEWSPDGQALFVAEKSGLVRVVDGGVLLPVPFIDIRDEVNTASDRGLIGLALHPDFPVTPWVYLLYTHDPAQTVGQTGPAGPDAGGQRVSRLDRVTADSATGYRTALAGSRVALVGGASTWQTIGDPAAEQTDLSAPWSCGPAGAHLDDCIPADGLSHSVGTLAFGLDGMLYAGNGDAATWTTVDERALRALDPDSLAGKILRLDPATGAGLPDNPFWDGNAGSNRSRVWQVGLRNPFRFRFDPATGELWLGDVGWETWEELNHGPAGADFGWPCFEGDDSGSLEQPGYASTDRCQTYYGSNSAVPAAWAYPHVPGIGGAIIVGDFYTHNQWPVDYHGALLVSDYSTRQLSRVNVDGGTVTVTPFADQVIAVDLVFGPDGHLYIADPTTGRIDRITYTDSSDPSVDVRISGSDDDAEERANGHVHTSSPRLELAEAQTAQTIGLRFDGVDIPPGAVIDAAWIQFTSARASNGPANLLIEGQLSDDAVSFARDSYDISTRPRTTAAVSWLPPPWTGTDQAGSAQRTPDLTGIVSEIVTRPGWVAGNALAFLITGSGEHTAHSVDGLPAAAPLLHLAWSPSPNEPPLIAIGSPTDGAAFTQGSAIAFSGSAADSEDDDASLTAMLSWSSSLDGIIGAGGSFVTSALSPGNHEITASVADSSGAIGQATILITVTTNSAPVVSIATPTGNESWLVDQAVAYSGAATDAEDGELPGSALVWEAVIHHNTHTHLDYLTATGASGTFPYPDHDDNSHVELCLSGTDSGGSSTTDCVDLFPLEVLYTFESDPPGLTLSYNGQSGITPFSVLAAAGGGRQISAPSPQGNWHFASWNIGGGATQQITIADTGQTLRATFNAAPTVDIASPVDGTTIAPGESLVFSGSASDPEDDDAALTAGLSWVSSLDGVIGQGGSFAADNLSTGTHVVTASVTDSGGLVGDASVTVTVADAPAWVAVASYQADFLPDAHPAGWGYLWNAGGAIGDQAGYAPLAWNGGAYDSDGAAGLPDASELRYGYLDFAGGHAGQGTGQGAATDRYVIAAVTVPTTATYRLGQSAISLNGCQWTNGLDLRVLVNDTPAHQVSVPPGGVGVVFDTPLGTLSAGDRVYVAAGPAGRDGCDAFDWDFTIERGTTGPPANSAPVVTNPGDQSSLIGETVTLPIIATDADNDVLTYAMTGAPDGLVLDPVTGIISGVPTTAGTYAVEVSVSDGQVDSPVSFGWTVEASGQTWLAVASYTDDFPATQQAGWLYQWNGSGPVGTSAGYIDLQWNGAAYDSDGLAGFPDDSEMRYGRLVATGGHAGQGSDQGAAHDRYAIAGYAVSLPGAYRISDSSAAQTGCAWSNGLDLRVYVNDTLIVQQAVESGGASVSFDSPLGQLLAGDRIYVAAGPSARDGCDAFTWAFVLEKAD